MKRKRYRVRRRCGGERFGLKRAKTEKRVGTLFTYFGLACDEAWVQVHCAMCAMQTLPLMLDAKFFQHLLCRRQQASHQTPTLYPPLQMAAKAR